MKYTEEMILQSDSGYCMPFEEQQGKDVELSLGYGEQTDPVTGEKFFHHGIDFNVRCYMLSALASGIVSGVGNDSGHGICQTIRYGEYEVTYGNLSNVFAQFGQRVKAGQTVALSGDKLHMTVRFKGEELNPLEFLTMLYGNIQAMRQAGGHETDYPSGVEMELGTDYDRDKREIEELMLRFLPHYMEDLRHGAYTLPRNTEQSLRHIFTVGAMKEYFYENMPSMANPLGLGHKAMPLACKVQNLHATIHPCCTAQYDCGQLVDNELSGVRLQHDTLEMSCGCIGHHRRKCVCCSSSGDCSLACVSSTVSSCFCSAKSCSFQSLLG
jgi:hypothetical protein